MNYTLDVQCLNALVLLNLNKADNMTKPTQYIKCIDVYELEHIEDVNSMHRKIWKVHELFTDVANMILFDLCTRLCHIFN